MGGVASPTADSIGCYSLTRPNLQRALYAALPPGTVTCNASFHSFTLREDGRVEVTLALSDGGSGGVQGEGAGSGTAGGEGAGALERVEVCDLLVGADGIRSRVRACLQGGWATAVTAGWLAACEALCSKAFGWVMHATWHGLHTPQVPTTVLCPSPPCCVPHPTIRREPWH